MIRFLPFLLSLAFLGREVPLTTPETDVAASTQSAAFVASDGASFLVVWTDNRAALSDVYAARVAADGRILDPLGILVLRDAYSAGVVWNGERYLVGAVTAHGVWAVPIANGRVGEPRRVFGTDTPPGAVGMATNGETTLMVTASGMGALLDRHGVTIASPALPSRASLAPAVAAASHSYLVAFAVHPGSVALHTVDLRGQVVASSTTPFGPGPDGIALASDGERFLVAISGPRLHWRLYRDAVTPLGPLVENVADEINFRYHAPRVIWRGGEFLITYAKNDPVAGFLMRAVRTKGEAAIGSPMAFATVPSQTIADMTLARDGRGVAVWPRIGGSLRMARFDASTIASGIPFADERPVAYSAHAQSAPVLLNANGVLLAWWTEVEEGRSVVKAGRVGAVPATISGVRSDRLEVITDGSSVWFVWWDAGVFARRYDLDLQPLGQTLRLDDPESGPNAVPAAAAGDGILVVVWQNRSADLDGARVEGTTFTRFALARAEFEDEQPAVTWNGREFVAAWVHETANDWWQFGSAPGRIMARRLARDGRFVDAEPVIVFDGGANRVTLGHIAPAPGGAAILWSMGARAVAALFTGTPLPPSREIAFGHQVLRFVPFGDGHAALIGRESGGRFTEIELLELTPSLDIRRRTPVDFGDARGVTLTPMADRFVFGYQRLTEEAGRVWRAYVLGLPEAGPRRRVAR